MFATWMDILNEIPKAVLWLIDDNATTTSNLRAHALKAGADVDRILFTPRASHEEYRAKLKMADVFLDTFPYNCGSTTNDVINAGVPLVTMSGRTMVSRMGASVMSMFNGEDNVATTFEQYKQICHMAASSVQKIKKVARDRQLSLAALIEQHASESVKK
jgi:predicted O-linked N-acetylglucosamine transferase (SPINDLY family)